MSEDVFIVSAEDIKTDAVVFGGMPEIAVEPCIVVFVKTFIFRSVEFACKGFERIASEFIEEEAEQYQPVVEADGFSFLFRLWNINPPQTFFS